MFPLVVPEPFQAHVVLSGVISRLHWLDQFSPFPPPESPAALADKPHITTEDVSSRVRMGDAHLTLKRE